MTLRLTHHLNAVLERWLPEQRLFLKSDSSARFVRLRPLTQVALMGGTAIVFGWTIIASSILVIDAASDGSSRDQVARSQASFENRLAALSAERDARAAEALAAQDRFASALDQVSRMQTQLLASESRNRELETGIGVVQASLHDAVIARNLLAADPQGESEAAHQAADRVEEFSVALDILSDELKQAVTDRDDANREMAAVQARADEIAQDRDRILARNDALFTEIENAVSISFEPLDAMFRKAGVDSDQLLRSIRSGYSGTGGPLNTASVSTRGNADITQDEARTQEIMISLDRINTYRIAIDKMPLAMPVKSAFRFTSPYGQRWGRRHEGIDLAAPVGTPIFAPGEGEVIFAGWQRGYGNLIKIRHELGVETRYGHLSRIRVKVGQKVSRGALIGDMGNTGRSTGSHLHYEIRVNGQSVDPMSFIKAAQNVF